MTSRQLHKADVHTLVEWYAAAAAAHGVASSTGDYRTANKEWTIITSVYRELRSRGSEAQLALLELVSSPDDYVRSWAAAHALEFAPEVAEPVLTELANRPRGLASLDAEMALREWRAGKLHFPK